MHLNDNYAKLENPSNWSQAAAYQSAAAAANYSAAHHAHLNEYAAAAAGSSLAHNNVPGPAASAYQHPTHPQTDVKYWS